MLIWHKPASIPDAQLKMQTALNHLRGVPLGQILPHVRDNGEIGLENLPAVIELLEAAFGDHDRVATAKWIMLQIKQKNPEFSKYYAEFEVIAADREWNPAALWNALTIWLAEARKN